MTAATYKRVSVPGNLVSFAVFFSVLCLWVGAAPMFATPDETAHMVRATSLVHGNSVIRGEDKVLRFEVSEILDSHTNCYAFMPEQTADCLDIAADEGSVLVSSSAGTYPPLFHLIIGAPRLVSSGLKSLYFMRLANAMACAAFLTLALANIRQLPRRSPVVVGLAVGITPMVLFVSGPASSSGIATTAGLAVWTAGMVLLEEKCTRSIAASSVALAVPLCAMLLTRRDSLMWGGAMVVVLVAYAPWKRVKDLLAERAALMAVAVVGAAAAAQYLIWTGENAAGFNNAGKVGGTGDAGKAFADTVGYLWQAIGVLGWLDTPLPDPVYYSWWGALLALFLGSMAVASFRSNFSVVLAVTLLLGLTTYIGSVRYPYFQGRYYMPFAIGIPVLAGAAISKGKIPTIPRRSMFVVLGWLYLMHQVAFWQHLRRYSVGAHGTWLFAIDSQWSPPGAPNWVYLLGYAVTTGAMMWLFANAAYGAMPTPTSVSRSIASSPSSSGGATDTRQAEDTSS